MAKEASATIAIGVASSQDAQLASLVGIIRCKIGSGELLHPARCRLGAQAA